MNETCVKMNNERHANGMGQHQSKAMGTQNRTELFQQVLTQLLRPLSRAMIAHGVTLNAATEALKQSLVDAATDSNHKRITDSKVSLLTGLHRKDVRRLRAEDPRPIKRPLMNACSLAIAHWTSNPDFCDTDGKPKPLPRVGSTEQQGFDDLVKAAKIDLPPATLLVALQTESAIEVSSDDNQISLVQEAFLGKPDSEAILTAYEKNLSAHFHAATDNLLTDTISGKHFERAGHYSHLSKKSTRELNALAKALSMECLQTINAKALTLQARDSSDPEAAERFSIGTYIYTQSSDDTKKSE
jgi:hypothetical protein